MDLTERAATRLLLNVQDAIYRAGDTLDKIDLSAGGADTIDGVSTAKVLLASALDDLEAATGFARQPTG